MYTRAFRLGFHEVCRFRPMWWCNGEKACTTESMRFPVSCWCRRATAEPGLSVTAPESKPDGRSIVMSICRPITESSSLANSSSRPHQVGTSITRSFGLGTNSDGTYTGKSHLVRLIKARFGDLHGRAMAGRMSVPVPVNAPVKILLAMTVVTGIVDAVSFLTLG